MNYYEEKGEFLKYLRKTMRIMRLSLFLIIISTAMAFSASSYSQNAKFSMDLNNVTVKEVIESIENQSEFIFFYQEKHVDLDRQVTIQANEKDIETILDQVFAGTDNIYVINDRQIVIGKAPENELEKQIQSIKDNVKPVIDQPQQKEITGTVTDSDGFPLPGVTVVVTGTTIGTVTNGDGEFTLNIPDDAETLQFSFVGMKTQELPVEDRTTFTVVMEVDAIGIEEVVAVGYGVQKKSDVTGAVATVSQERLEMAPNVNVNQIIQGSVPGVIVQTSTAGASPNEVLMVRGRNSIAASNEPLIIVDGIPYAGGLNEINPKDIASINVLKDASAAAIYGSRGSNGVIIITTKEGGGQTPRFSYDGRIGLQSFANVPDIMDGEEFYNFKLERCADCLTQAEEEIYNAREWEDWPALGLRQGYSHEHVLSVSRGFENTQYYLSGSLLNVQGIAKNDDFKRISGRVNITTDIIDWISLGTRSQFTYSDRSGVAPSISQLFYMNPLTSAYDEDGNLAVYPWPEDQFFGNPLAGTLYENVNETFQLVSNNFAVVDFPFIPGLSYRLNTGITFRFGDNSTFRGRDTKAGLEARGSADLNRSRYNSLVVENILSYNKEIGVHNLFVTGVYSYENDIRSTNSVSADVFPHDFIGWHAIGQAELIVPNTAYNETHLVSQMIRLNYIFDRRYLLTLTGRRDGFSGFGADNRWGLFPSASLAWNLHNEDFFAGNTVFSELKPRVSYGLNGNQAVGAYQYIARLGEYNMVVLNQSVPGYRPATLANADLGWESSRTLNLGVDFGILEHRISGDFNVYHTNTTDLLLERAISPVHGITSIVENIGETQNQGLEFSIHSRNVVISDFSWNTTGNLAFFRNEIVELYGDGRDDVANRWFIGEPISANYDWVWDGTWQLDEAEEAESWGSQPGYVKLKDVDNDDQLTGDDRQIIGKTDPTFLWGMTNTVSYKNLTFSVFIHGVHGVTKHNTLMTDDETYAEVRRNTIKKNWWTEDNPTNDWIKNDRDAHLMSGIEGRYYENADFLRIKDVSLSYDLSENFVNKLGLSNVNLYLTGRNLYTVTKWQGLDPELNNQLGIPLQRELTLGLNMRF